MKKLSFILTLSTFAIAVSIATLHSGGGDAREITAIYWAVLSIKLMADIMISKGV